jgi:hypothetical protein
LFAHDAQVGVALGRLRPQLERLFVRFGGLLPAPRFMMRQPQVEPSFEVRRHGRHQQCAEFRRERVIARRAGPGCQALQRNIRFGLQLEQPFGELADHVEILLRHADQHQVGQRFFRLGVMIEDALIDLRRLVRMT